MAVAEQMVGLTRDASESASRFDTADVHGGVQETVLRGGGGGGVYYRVLYVLKSRRGGG